MDDQPVSKSTKSKLTDVLGGTTHYITEYLLMIASLSGLVTSVILMIFSICNLLTAGDVAGLSTASGLSAVVAFIVFGPLYYALSKRVRSEELKDSTVASHKARTVFTVLAGVSAFGWFTGFVITSIYFLMSPLITKDASYGDNFVNVFLPALFAATAVGLALVSIMKKAGTRYVARFASIALLVGAILAIVTMSVAIAKKDQKPTLKSGEKCTYENYDKGKCTYDDYQKYLDDLYPSTYKSPTSKYDDYQDDNNLDNDVYDY